jgi:DNA-binding Xre family transcriptional regulator
LGGIFLEPFVFFDKGKLIIQASGFQKKMQKAPKNKLKEHLKLWRSKIMKTSKITTLDEFKDRHFGVKETQSRNKLEDAYENFKLGTLLHSARLEKGMTQAELAEKVGTTKSYISKIENNVKEVRLSTLQKIVQLGLGGQLDLSIRL